MSELVTPENTDVMTRYELYQQLNNEREIVIDSNSSHVVKKEAWERIDFLLDVMIDLNFLETVVTDGEG
jgi:hypothetical protein